MEKNTELSHLSYFMGAYSFDMNNIFKENIEVSIKYIIYFLLRNNGDLGENVHYLDEASAIAGASGVGAGGQIYIVRSEFFDENIYGTQQSVPALVNCEEIKVLYGKNLEKRIGNNLVLYQDIIASAYFMMSRYEQFLYADNRNQYTTFPAKDAFSVRHDLINKPIVDEYAVFLLERLRVLGHDVIIAEKGICKIWFTHDIDVPFNRYSLKLMVKTIGRAFLKEHRLIIHPFLNWLGYYKVNPRNTWKYMLRKEKRLRSRFGAKIRSICFIISLKEPDTFSMAYIDDKKTPAILNKMTNLGAAIGLHTSYEGAETQEAVEKEKTYLENACGETVYFQRNHYLRQIDPSDMVRYERAGFTDDFTCGYNEVAGFMLGTCHPVRFIDPADGRLHKIMLHGLHIMDGSLSGEKPYQMSLTYESARDYCKNIIDEVYKHGGELCLLWHNGEFGGKKGKYHKNLYDWIINYCEQIR